LSVSRHSSPRTAARKVRPGSKDELIVVNASNHAIGRGEKHAVHERGLLHRAFSICLFDAKGRMLLQRRNPAKYHSGGLWANSCCGHPRPGERTVTAAKRRLGEELGAEADLSFGFITRYDAQFANGLAENEIVYVYFGLAPRELEPNPVEVSAVAMKSLPELRRDIRKHPDAYAVWLRHYVLHHFDWITRGATGVLKPRGGAG
jgi:isopentenyl-diphosphate delta-isomerase